MVCIHYHTQPLIVPVPVKDPSMTVYSRASHIGEYEIVIFGAE